MSDQKDWSRRQEQFKGSSSAGVQTARRRRETTSVRKCDRSAAVAKRRLLAPLLGDTFDSRIDRPDGEIIFDETLTAESSLTEAQAACRVLLSPPNEAELFAALRG